uniref:ubiquitinyl hydrolase 1 n=1 Tax=Theileria annulata TaxID=5874 RepID=A0A3B0N5J6_THEAN
MSNARTYLPYVIELHNKSIKFTKYSPSNSDLLNHSKLNTNEDDSQNKFKTFPVLKNLKNSQIRGIYHLPKVKWDDESMTMGAGLNNPGINICYMNVIIQVLTHTPFLASSLLNSYHSKTCLHYEKDIFCIMCLFENYVKKSFASPNPLNNPFYSIAKKFIWSRFKLGHQDDAFIFLKHFLDSLSKACYLNSKESEKQEDGSETTSGPKDFISNDQIMSTVIGRLFGGYFRNVIVCNNCSRKSEKVEEFFDLAVEVTKSNRLIDLLSEFVLPEKLTNDNKYFCSNCKSYQNANKSLSIYKAPRILNINLKRFNLYSSVYKKSLKAIEFPQLLSISLKTSEDSYTWLNYDLYAIVCHIGKSLHMGHYITFIKGKHGFWYRFDDSIIQCVSESTVLSHNNDVYLLFYSINNESVGDCDTALNLFSYSNILKESKSSQSEPIATPEREPRHCEIDILSYFGGNTIFKRFLKHRKFKNYNLLNMKLLSNIQRMNNLKRKINSIVTNNQENKEPIHKINKKEKESKLKDTDTDLKSEVKCSLKHTSFIDAIGDEDVSAEIELWSDAEDIETYNKLYEQIDPELPKPTEEDLEYDRGKIHKSKNRNRPNPANVELVNHRSGINVAVEQKNLFDNTVISP